MKTQAAVLVETGQPLELWELEIPKLGAGQVLVELAYSGACRTQVLEARGAKGEDRWVPHCLGHEGVGTVVETGAGIARVKPGDRVLLSWLKGAGLEADGATYTCDGRTVNAGGVTTFQKHSVCSENRLWPLPEGIDPMHGIMLGCALPTGFGSVVNTGHARIGESIAVFGAGGIGLSAILAANTIGAYPVIAVDLNDSKLQFAKVCGATHIVNATDEDALEQIRVLTVGKGVDLAIEATGNVHVMRTALESVRARGGRAVVVGNADYKDDISFSPSLLNQGKSLLGTWGGDCIPDRDFPVLSKLMVSGKIDVSPLLSAPYTLGDINVVLDDLEAGHICRPVIDLSRD